MNETPGTSSDDVPGDHPADELAPVQAEWRRRLDELTAQWEGTVTPAQQAELREQIVKAIDEGDLSKLAELAVGTAAAADLLAAAMALLAVSASTAVVTYAASVGVIIGTVTTKHAERMTGIAGAVAESLGRSYATLAGNEAIRRATPGKPGREVADEVGTYLTTLKTGTLRAQLGGALTQAQQLGREAALRQAEDDGGLDARYFATEVLDSGTCVNCRAIDGRELPTLDAAMLAYGGGPYISCLGLWRCRGTFVARWFDEHGEVLTSARPREDHAHPVQFKSGHWLFNGEHWREQPRDDKGRWTDHGATALHELVDVVKALGPIGRGDHWSRLSGGAGEQGVWLATLPDGRKIVAKTHPSWADPDDTRMYVQADVLASKVQQRLGVPSATVVADKDDDTTAWIEHVPGDIVGTFSDAEQEAFRDSPAGARMGFADVLTYNVDRNPGNIIVTPENEAVGIDQSFSFLYFDVFQPDSAYFVGKGPAPSSRYVSGAEPTTARWADNPLTQADVGKAREVIDAMKGDFTAAGHEDWHAGMLKMLGELAEHATGTENVL